VTTECFVVTDVHTMVEEDQAVTAYVESYEGPGIPVRLDPGEVSGSSAEIDLNRSEERVPRRAEGHCRYWADK
jgi:hypothetical protein